MKAPLCKTCGKEHWSRLCHTDRVERHAERDIVTAPVTDVTTIVTPRQGDLETENRRLREEVERLSEEVRQLKQGLARAPLSAAERQRRRRAKGQSSPSSSE